MVNLIGKRSSDRELEDLRKAAKIYAGLSEDDIGAAVAKQALSEVLCDDEEVQE